MLQALVEITNPNPRAVEIWHPGFAAPQHVLGTFDQTLVPYVLGMTLVCPSGKAKVIVRDVTDCEGAKVIDPDADLRDSIVVELVRGKPVRLDPPVYEEDPPS